MNTNQLDTATILRNILLNRSKDHIKEVSHIKRVQESLKELEEGQRESAARMRHCYY
jgi:hypothetical protein